MSRLYSLAWLALCCLALPQLLQAQGVTTASIGGRVTDDTGEGLIGAMVVAVHEPSGTTYGNATDLEGYYRLPNMRVGGPYTITTSYTGYGTQVLKDVRLRLGEDQEFNFSLDDSATEIATVQVIARAGTAGANAGASTQITTAEIEALPTLNRDISDFTRLTPQSTGAGGGTSFAGVNNRFNAIYIDGAVNNDVFGLASSGTNGGQTGAAPFSIDIIDQFQVVLSPYDVSLGGFAGGGINAVTKSGTNEFSGTAYYFFQNEQLAGKTNGRLVDQLGRNVERERFDEFSQRTFGASLGGPIIENKLFFFANVELQRDETPAFFDFEQYEGNSSFDDINGLRNRLINEFGYDPGTFGNTSEQLDASRFFVKLNYNINEDHQLVARHNYNNIENFRRNVSGRNQIDFSNNGVYFPSLSNSSALELNSTFGTSASNNLILGYTRVTDNRDPLGDPFPRVEISDGFRTSIVFGSEPFSTGNLLEQSTFTLTDNFKLYRGNHTYTFGTHNELYSFNNVFVRQNFGQYQFNSLDDFLNGAPASRYDRTYSLVDEGIGDDTEAAANFSAMQLGFYAQDQVEVNSKLTLTAGLRLDIPFLLDDPVANPQFFNPANPDAGIAADTTLAKLDDAYAVARRATPGRVPEGQLMFSPRVGFTYNFRDEMRTTLRGGVGIFTSRIPFVWPGGMFTNNGVVLGSVDEDDLTDADVDIFFRPNIRNQYTNPGLSGGAPGGQVDLFTDDFRYPQVFRTNRGIDRELPLGIRATAEGIFTKTLNNIVYTNVNSDPTVEFAWTGGPDDRPVFTRERLAPELNGDVYVASNTNRGYSYTLTGTLARDFANGFNAQISYTWGDAYALSEGTSSQNSSGWRGQQSINGRNEPLFGRSDFALGHRVLANLNYRGDWTGDDRFTTTISIFYNGQKSNPYSYVLGPDRSFRGQNPNNERGSTSRNRSLVYIPATREDINLVDVTDDDGNVVLSADQQWAELERFIRNDDYLNENRGGYADKNGAWAPFQSMFDLAIRQNFGITVGSTVQRFQVSFDVFNFANLLNSRWGTTFGIPGGSNRLLYSVVGFEADGTTPQFVYDPGDRFVGEEALNLGGRWRSRLGLRYLFN